ncbi:biosynthetic peptidoglycan transglycosylase [Citrifermentans bemidjiense Bem]|uniref:Biosynthetic peptidoglycan transglycosylase n=1 Tax=Citrifermentans bemidjiense (strain ATCC BAA-1014 / DSM 16622 / JCM 12645 / Bem) TaxID=404380 RepID=B5E8C7_CITBB|nr:biosynthetic peptidoglycan transglycosylase [Citrifermentans bemidjiense]ACH37110.1 biosynthetic peptidoglycan transglycosylase [Citrifermentans bemidjiense Bem]
MKKYLTWGGIVLAVYLIYVVISLAMTPPVTELKDKKFNMTIQVKDWQGNYHPLVVGPKNRYWTPLSQIPSEMKWAVILAEDASFYKHEGIDVKAIKEAIKYDLEKQSFARGASTITQQVAKNLFLSREKTLTRKAKELYLAKRMEQELTKGRIIELYLNVIELGPLVHGIGHGARYYFGKSPANLTPRECAFLAAMLPGPRVAYNPYKNLGKVLKRSNMILGLLAKKGVLSEAEYRTALAQSPNVGRMQRKVDMSIKQVEVMANHTSATLPEQPLSQEEMNAQEPKAGAPEGAAPQPAPEPAQEPASPASPPAAQEEKQ